METLFYLVLIGAAVGVVVGVLMQLIGMLFVVALTLGAGVRDYWANHPVIASGQT